MCREDDFKSLFGKIEYYKYGMEITEKEYEQYLNSIKKGVLDILSIGKNTLDLIIEKYIVINYI